MSTSKTETLSVITRSPERTIELGRRLGKLLRRGELVALFGDLGAGKTQITKGIALGCGVASVAEVTSPTFILMNEYKGRLAVYHFDAYRLGGSDDLVALGAHEFFDREGVSVVEWAEKVEDALPDDRVEIDAQHVSQQRRRFDFTATGVRSDKIIKALAKSIRKP